MVLAPWVAGQHGSHQRVEDLAADGMAAAEAGGGGVVHSSRAAAAIAQGGLAHGT